MSYHKWFSLENTTRESKVDATITYDLALEVTCHHFQHLLLVTQVDPIQHGEDSTGMNIRVAEGQFGAGYNTGQGIKAKEK